MSLTLEGYLALAKLSSCFPRPGHFWRNLSPELQQALISFEQGRETNFGQQQERTGRLVIDMSMPSPQMESVAYVHLETLENALGPSAFKKHVGTELRERVEKAKAWAATSLVANYIKKSLSHPMTLEISRQVQQAREGDPNAIRQRLEDTPLATLADKDIARHISQLQYSSRTEDLERLKRIASSFRKGLIRTRSGRKAKLPDRKYVQQCVIAIQKLYEADSRKLRPQYRTRRGLERSIAKLSDRVTAELPEWLRDDADRAIRSVLFENCKEEAGKLWPKRWCSAFGTAVAARMFNCSEKLIRSALKN